MDKNPQASYTTISQMFVRLVYFLYLTCRETQTNLYLFFFLYWPSSRNKMFSWAMTTATKTLLSFLQFKLQYIYLYSLSEVCPFCIELLTWFFLSNCSALLLRPTDFKNILKWSKRKIPRKKNWHFPNGKMGKLVILL